MPVLAPFPPADHVKLVAIGTSAGGPLALQSLLTRLPADFPYSIVIVQHMLARFTPSYAQQLDRSCLIHVKEAQDGDELRPATALLAPGGKQMRLARQEGRVVVRICDGEADEIYKPSVDITFNSVAQIFPAQTLAIILTGMGIDGVAGCRSLKAGGATVWTEDESSCVVYGMPAAVVEAGLSDRILNLDEIATALIELAAEAHTHES